MKHIYKSKYLLALFLLLFYFIGIQCQERTFSITGYISDYITGKPVLSKVELMTLDSVVIDSTTAQVIEGSFGVLAYYQLRAHQKGKFIIRASMKSYADAYVMCEILSNRQSVVSAKEIHMQMLELVRNLPEVTVRATKVKMVMRGDTIVYNADAFNLADGSMLDALISRLPGAKLTKEGEIFVKGKKVESLLVNGRDFFSGNPQVALQNLPSYIVNKVKVYNKLGQVSQIMGRDMDDKMIVMDVLLKREYAKNYIGNLEGGIGTADRYLSRGLGLKFSDKEQVVGFFNINNLNDNRFATFGGDWSPQEIPDGLLATKTIGLSYQNNLRGAFDQFSTNLYYTHTGTDNETRSNYQIFLPTGDSFVSSSSKDVNNSKLLKGNTYLLTSIKNMSSKNQVDFSWMNRKGIGNSLSETRDSALLLNRMLFDHSYEAHDFNINLNSSNILSILQMDHLDCLFAFNYDRLSQKSLSLTDVTYNSSNIHKDYRNKFVETSNQDLKLKADIFYDYSLNSGSILVGYGYNYSYNKARNMLYRLDKLSDRDSSHFNMLPSAVEAMADVLDEANSYHFQQFTNEHTITPAYSYKNQSNHHGFCIRLPLRQVSSNLYYDRLGRHNVGRRRLFFEPNFSIWSEAQIKWRIEAKMSSSIPDLTTMVDFRDDSDPLKISLGNSSLKDIHQYDVKLSLSRHGEMQRLFFINIGYRQINHAVAYALTFDKLSGISTTQPMSVNGNRYTDMTIGYSRALDSTQIWTISNQLKMSYNRNVDMATVEGYTKSQRSIVNNWMLNDNVSLNFRASDNYDFSFFGGGCYYLINSRRKDFRAIHAGDYNIGFNATLNIPWNFQIATDMTMFARRGWQQNEMNTTDWVWNAQVTRSFIKGKLVTKLQGFDILHQLSTTQYAVNSQGRTETWHNSIPRYVMFSLAWRFNVNPRKH